MIRETGLPRWYIKKRAAALGLTMHPDKRPWTAAEQEILERLLGRVSALTVARRLRRTEASLALKIKRLGVSRRVRSGYTMRELEECLGEGHYKIQAWIANGWLRDTLQGTRRHDGNGRDIHRFREKDILEILSNFGYFSGQLQEIDDNVHGWVGGRHGRRSHHGIRPDLLVASLHDRPYLMVL
jgi:hypothetical protein